MPDVPPIILPDDLIPSDGRFGSGPSKVRDDAVASLARGAATYLGTSHRRARVKDVVAEIRAGLTRLYTLPAGYEVLLGVGGCTLFWEAAALSLIDRRSEHLVFGEFSSKFRTVVAETPYLDPPVVIESPPGSAPDADPSVDVDTFALTHNETSTGVMVPVRRPRDDGSLVVVDGTSAAGATLLDPDAFDAYYFSPQKGFGSEGGLWIALCSPAAVARIEAIAASDRWIPPMSSLVVALDNSRKNQTYNTPSLTTLFLLADQISWLERQGGLEWAALRSQRSSSMIYRWAESSAIASPFVSDPRHRSTTVVTIDLVDSVPAATLTGVLRNHGIIDIEGYRKLGRNQLRIATFPNVEPDDVATLLGAIDYVVGRLE
jgi:phosphoserine aminotransferase